MNPRAPQGFTLIELLVVITIVAVLLTLLLPALETAVYRAELVRCAARLDGIGTSVQSYAAGNKRAYPVFDPYDAGVQPANIRGPIGGGGAGNSDPFDYRPTVKTYMPLNNLQCPMTGKMDLEDNLSQWIWTNYDIRAGFGFRGFQGMRRMGDRWEFTDTLSSPASPKSFKFDIIVSDIDTHTDKDRSSGSHQDYGDQAKMVESREHDQLYYFELWGTNKDGLMRGLVDLNWAYQDGSAATIFGIKPPPPEAGDERMALIPCWGDKQQYTNRYFRQVPKP